MDSFEKLKKMVAADAEPKLLADEIQMLLESFARKDKNGKLPSEAEWIPTYDLNKAAAEGWRWKAGKASELVSVDLDGERMSSQMVFEHCQQMAKEYSRKNTVSLGVATQ